MGTSILRLIQEIRCFKIKPLFLNNPDSNINFFMDLPAQTREFADDCCYIGTTDQILKLQPDCGTFICRWDDSELPTNLNINVLSAETDLDIAEMSRSIADVFERIRRLETKKLMLTEACLSKKGIRYLLEVANKIFKNPLFVCDTIGSLILFVSDTPIDEPMCNELQRDKIISHSMFKSALDRNLFVEMERNDNVYLYHGIYCTRWFHGIEEKGHIVAFLVLNAVLHPFTEEDEILFRALGALLSLEWKRSEISYNDFSDYRNYAFLHLLEGKDDDPTALVEIEKKLIKKNSDALRVVVLRYLNESYADSVHNFLQSTLTSTIPNAIVTVFHGNITIAYPNPISVSDHDTRMMFQPYAESYGLRIGISRSMFQYTDLQNCCVQALRAIEIGSKLFPDQCVYLYSECAFYDLLEKSGTALNWNTLCDERLIALAEYDKKNNSKYLSTLASFLDCDCSPKETCGVMFIHRNTLRYRLNSIRELTSLNFEDSKTIFQLKISLEIMRHAGQLE